MFEDDDFDLDEDFLDNVISLASEQQNDVQNDHSERLFRLTNDGNANRFLNGRGNASYSPSMSGLAGAANRRSLSNFDFGVEDVLGRRAHVLHPQSRVATPRVQQRRFPGPAGLLPKLNPGDDVPSGPTIDPETDKPTTPVVSSQEVLSQSTGAVFDTGPWQHMLKDMDLSEDDPQSPLRKFNVQWVRRKAGLRHFIAHKVPFLALVVRTMDNSTLRSTDTSALFRDRTGEIPGTLTVDVLEEYGHLLVPGSVLVLRHVGVFAQGSSKRSYLTITSNNIIKMYYVDQEEANVTTVEVSGVSKRELLQSIEEWQKSMARTFEETRFQQGPKQNTLFKSVVGSNNEFGDRRRNSLPSRLPCSFGNPSPKVQTNQRNSSNFPSGATLHQNAVTTPRGMPAVESPKCRSSVFQPKRPRFSDTPISAQNTNRSTTSPKHLNQPSVRTGQVNFNNNVCTNKFLMQANQQASKNVAQTSDAAVSIDKILTQPNQSKAGNTGANSSRSKLERFVFKPVANLTNMASDDKSSIVSDLFNDFDADSFFGDF